MKKILIASTALVAAGLMTAGPAAASEKIKLNLGGYSKWWMVGAWQEGSYEAGTGVEYANVDIKGDNEIFFAGDTKLDNGMMVGVQVELEAGGDAVGNDRIDKSYVYVSGGFGKVILGSEANGTALLHVMAPEAAANNDADGVLTGGWAISRPANVSRVVATVIDTDAEAEGITYVAPTFYGLTIGGSYKPSATEDSRAAERAQEIYGIGALYAREFGPVGLKVSAGWVTYDLSTGTERSNEYSTGFQVAYSGFTLGASYRNINQNERGGLALNAGNANNLANSSDTQAFDVGLTYATGPYTVGAYYFKSKSPDTIATEGDDVFEVYQVSGAYNLGAGVDLLATVGHAEYDDETAAVATGDANHNKGWAVMTGLALTF
ncbi:porin [Magnetospirillum sp. UT-4]|uniref:porin n=1 Tax=Magnetospirillum sp. UT-4 TaxID=2681467 RepID=UPI00138646E9|nr:porin [Magnetospirillum sp. UT-4]CAA7621874.1 Outer membrane protein (Porin) [Magnetospirillum sp. UT-4]